MLKLLENLLRFHRETLNYEPDNLSYYLLIFLGTGKPGWSVNKNRDRHINGACDNLIAGISFFRQDRRDVLDIKNIRKSC